MPADASLAQTVDSKFTSKPAIQKLMCDYSSEHMDCLDNIKRGISLNKTVGRYSTAMKKNKDKYPYLTRHHDQSPENRRSKCRSTSRGRPYMNTKPFGIETPRPLQCQDRADWAPQPREIKEESSRKHLQYTEDWLNPFAHFAAICM